MSDPVEFWFDLASTYSYPAAMRVEGEAAKRGLSVHWRPFLLGPIFAAQGWDTSPFNIYPAKGRYMWRDMERRCEALGLPFNRPDSDDRRSFPQNSVLAARIALVGLEAGWGTDFCKRVYRAEFADGADIADQHVLARLAAESGAPGDVLTLATSGANKLRLRAAVEEAMSKGIFGAPTFTMSEELFWGEDRLEAALDWAAR